MRKKREPIVRADTPSGQRLGEIIVEIVENQLRQNDPPETKKTLKRLMGLGESRENAMRYIASVLIIELVDIAKKEEPFDLERYVRNLNALPELPDD